MLETDKISKSSKRRRTSWDMEEEQSRTLYLRFPHPIKSKDEIKSLFFGKFKIKLPQKTTRHCHVIFSTVRDKIANLKAIKKTFINEKHILVAPSKLADRQEMKKAKLRMLALRKKEKLELEKHLLVSNIPNGVEASEVKAALTGAVAITFMNDLKDGKRQAQVQMETKELCSQFLTRQIPWPTLNGECVVISLPRLPKNRFIPKEEEKMDNPVIKEFTQDHDTKQSSDYKVTESETRKETVSTDFELNNK
ncbi:uncharacterized protein LOC106657242 [Trichogramma pretiosum]|uniref:uncharacterized protein LOC106657242 n=1 Tax=Trichogramma pretiosum TaxID=7493 RepID=UPI0006C9911F|nr:uncharacterized protein LOC106657242 [Trichogramma pretiosum]